MLTGVVPEEPPNRMEHDGLKAPSALGVQAPKGLDAVMTDALALRADERIQTMTELKAALANSASYRPRRRAGRMRAAKTGIPKGVRLTLIAAAVLAVVVGIGAIFALSTQGDRDGQPLVQEAVSQTANEREQGREVQSQTDDAGSPSSGQVESAVEEVDAPSLQVGDIIQLGTFAGQAIDWRVLSVEGGKALLTSEHVLEERLYNEQYVEITWETCTLRQYLNGEFLQASFSADEQSRIATATNQNLDNPEYGTPGGNPTEDRVFLLSIDEVEKHFADNLNRVTDDIQKGFIQSWWLRSPGEDTRFAAYVNFDGSVYVFGGTLVTNGLIGGVRPALWLNL
jgi:hypothetical protein